RLVEPAQRRSAVARDQGGGIEAAAAIRAMLVQREAHERLNARHENPARLEAILPLEERRIGRLRRCGRAHVAATSDCLTTAGGAWGRSPETRKGPAGPPPRRVGAPGPGGRPPPPGPQPPPPPLAPLDEVTNPWLLLKPNRDRRRVTFGLSQAGHETICCPWTSRSNDRPQAAQRY